ncbi:hypothetical protein [Gayadomonas joobiniege]|uniref:hypothetical protein n=1 Tax=Gayadomonas joobiniege TaxID=1234606 RepID=UPI00036B6412|nr:hypothetical protein [Gayadomonas joobiniege]
MKFVLSILIYLITAINLVFAQTGGWNFNNNRIAISADGNNQADNLHRWPRADPDDWGGTAVALAIIAKLDARDNLVHYSYNNFVDAPAHTTETNEMADSVNGAIERWDFNKNKFFDASADHQAALDHLVKEISQSSAEDPLYFIHMGPAEFFYRAVKQVVEQGNAEHLSHVYVISHSGYNNNHLRRGDPKFDKHPVAAKDKHHTLAETISLSGQRLNYKQIQDQNAKWDANKLWNSEHDWSVWQWMKNHQDESIQWIYQRLKRHPKGVADCSDAGMVYYLLTGDDNGSPAKLQKLFAAGI